jgi:hypothetical protein
MSKVLSFRDLLLLDELKGYNEIQLLHPSMDATVNKYLAEIGFDVDYGILYVPNKHRDMQGNVGVGFRAVGEISINRSFINSPACSPIERIIAASYQDPSLARELASMLGSSVNFKMEQEAELEPDEEFPPELIEPDYEEVKAQIKMLETIRDQIRGPFINDYGNVKTAEEYNVDSVSA